MSDLNPRSDPNSPWLHIDIVPALVSLCLSMLGLAMIYSATRGRDMDNYDRFFLERQTMWVMVGAGLLVLMALVDYRQLFTLTPLIYIGGVVLLLFVRAFGTVRNGARSWFALGSFGFQPSELVKLAVIVALAWWLSRFDEVLSGQEFGVAVGIAGLPIALVVVQPDIGTAMVYAIIAGCMMLIGGAKLQHLTLLLAVTVTLVVIAANSPLLQEYQKERLEGFLDFGGASLADTWNVDQAQIAIGNGGLTGLGYGKGTQTNSRLVPEQETDFIFTVIGEELGFIGGVATLALFGLLLWRLYRVCVIAGDKFGALISVGVLAMLTFQMFQSIGMTMGLVPVTGIPLPFVSYGGSSALTSFLAIGLVGSVHMRRYQAQIDRPLSPTG